MLEDAGVELGINYPYPVVTAEESEAALARANKVIQQSLIGQNSDSVRSDSSMPVHHLLHCCSPAVQCNMTIYLHLGDSIVASTEKPLAQTALHCVLEGGGVAHGTEALR